MKIIVSGSLAYDRIMDFSGRFSDYIIPDKIDNLNVCFTVNGIRERFGGTAGNIAYALKLMGENPEISATIGHDHEKYLAWLMKNHLSTDMIRIVEDEFTACCFITTDEANNQITVFNTGAMNHSSQLDFKKLDPDDTIMIISPGNTSDMINYPRLCKENGIGYIFDPGQQLPVLPPEEIVNAIEGCRILISNDYELDMIMNITGLSKKALLDRTKTVIVTMGELGSRILTAKKDTAIPAAIASKVLDPTGAGDSYRGGLICGLVRSMDIEACARMGSVCASFAVGCYGTQEYSFSLEEFAEKLDSIH